MKIEIDIDDALLRLAAEFASARGQTLDMIIDMALRQLFQAPPTQQPRFRLRKHSFQGDGLRPGLSENDWRRIRELSY